MNLQTGINPPSSSPQGGTRRRERSLKWTIAAGLAGLFWAIGDMVGRLASFFQGWDHVTADLHDISPLTPPFRILITYGPLAIPLFGVVAASAWVLSDVYYRGRWPQWFLFAFFAFVIFVIFGALIDF